VFSSVSAFACARGCVCVCLCVVLVSSVCIQIVFLVGCYCFCGRNTGVAMVVELWGGDPLCWERAEYACPGYRECWTSICDVMCGFCLLGFLDLFLRDLGEECVCVYVWVCVCLCVCVRVLCF